MSPISLTASQWMKPRRGVAARVEGRRHVLARKAPTGAPAYVEMTIENPDVRCAPVDGRLDAEDLARVLTGFLGQPIPLTPTLRYVRSSTDGDASAYVFDEDSGMVYILD